VDQFRGHILLFLAVTVGSAIPFVPTGEMVSGSSALAAHSRLDIFLIFVVTWLASVIGDTLLLLEARFGARKLGPWLARRKYADKVQQAQTKLQRNAFSAIITGRLVPGGRAPVIIALGVGRYPVRRFLPYDAIACGLWALIYSTIGSLGGRLASHPLWGIVIAIAFAVCISLLVQQIIRLVNWIRHHRSDPETRHRELESRSDLLNDLTRYADQQDLPVEIDLPEGAAPTVPVRPEMRSERSPKRIGQPR
jgi:membrane protein DedA with SNARE-associated domain